MVLPEGIRQIVAGVVSSAVFLVGFLVLQLVWWVALIAAAAVFFAMLLIIRKKPPPEQDYAAAGVTVGDLKDAIAILSDAAARMRQLATRATETDAEEFRTMAELFEAIQGHHSRDPSDYRHTRRFIRSEIPRILETSEAYVDLASRARGGNMARVEALGERIRSFAPVLEKIDQACLENDFMSLEVQVKVLGTRLQSR